MANPPRDAAHSVFSNLFEIHFAIYFRSGSNVDSLSDKCSCSFVSLTISPPHTPLPRGNVTSPVYDTSKKRGTRYQFLIPATEQRAEKSRNSTRGRARFINELEPRWSRDKIDHRHGRVVFSRASRSSYLGRVPSKVEPGTVYTEESGERESR